MDFSNFRLNVLLRLAAFVALSFVALWGFINAGWQITPVVSSLLAILMIAELVRYVESVNRELGSFLDFVAHDDFSTSFPIGDKGDVFGRLEFAYKRLLDKYRNLNEARELNHRYLEALVEHVSVALICLDDSGEVTLMNRQAKQLFKIPHLESLTALQRVDPTLPGELERLQEGDRRLIQLTIDGEPLQLALYVTRFTLLDSTYKLISFQNIRTELEQREVDFSEKLIKVLTHEIMNSVTPIIALSKVIEESLAEAADKGTGVADQSNADDLLRSVASIQSRGDGLLRFVQAYRSLTSLPAPKRKQVEVAQLLEQTGTLLAPTVETAKVSFEHHVEEPDLTIDVDPDQIQQVLINLVNNAIDAVNGRTDGKIEVVGMRDEQGRATIRVSDNGAGISEDQLENIFVPFFTTKRQGTGVGLSVSRQLMFLNRGLISVKARPAGGSEFSLSFG